MAQNETDPSGHVIDAMNRQPYTDRMHRPSVKLSAPQTLADIAERIWQLPARHRETLEDLLEEKFVRTVLRRSREVSRLRKSGKLLTLRQLKQSFARR